MASSHGTPPVFNNKVIAWIDHRLPIFSYIEKEYHTFPTPRNFNYFWNFGAIATVMLVLMIVTGIVLATNYTPHVTMAFDSVERIMRDVPQGWLIRYLHMTGASFFFIAVYIHIFRGMYYGSYKSPRELLWILGVVILLLMMATAFMGYVLPWGQMSFWGATVITSLFSAIPVVGDSIVTWLWGGFAIDNPTLNRFYALHYLLPFVIVGVVALHVVALHVHGSNNPLGIDPKGPQDTVPFHPYYTMKDGFGVDGLPDRLCGLRLLRAQLPGRCRQLHPGQPAGDAAAHRARMVLPAVLRHPARHPRQAGRRSGHVRLDRRAVHPAVARHLARALVHVPADLQVVHVRAGDRRRSCWACAAPIRRKAGTCRWPSSARSTTSSTSSSCCRSWARSNGHCHCPPASPTRCSRRRRARTMRRTIVSAAIALAALAAGAAAIAAETVAASEAEQHPPHRHWHFDGPFGTYDRAAAQRGYQIYAEVCSACHSLQLLAYRNLMELGLTENQVKGLIKDIQVPDLGDDGQPIERPARLSDRFKKPFPNTAAAAAANNGKAPPDLSVIVKAREGGADYIHAPADRLRAVRQADAAADQGVQRHQGRQLRQVFPRPQDRHAAAARRRQGDLCRRHQGDARPGSRRRRRVPRLGVGAAHGGRARTPAFASSSSCWRWPA